MPEIITNLDFKGEGVPFPTPVHLLRREDGKGGAVFVSVPPDSREAADQNVDQARSGPGLALSNGGQAEVPAFGRPSQPREVQDLGIGEARLGDPGQVSGTGLELASQPEPESMLAFGDEAAAPLPLPGQDLVGAWRSARGQFSVTRNGFGKLVFWEVMPPLKLMGMLVPSHDDVDWFEGEIVDRADGDVSFGFLRLKMEGDRVRSSFKKRLDEPWDPQGLLAKKVRGPL